VPEETVCYFLVRFFHILLGPFPDGFSWAPRAFLIALIFAKMDVPRKKRRLNYEKCAFCRRDKQKVRSTADVMITYVQSWLMKNSAQCLPETRPWPGNKCDRCVREGLNCGPNQTTRQVTVAKPGASAAVSPAISTSIASAVSPIATLAGNSEVDSIENL